MFINLICQCLINEKPEKIIIVKPGLGDHGTSESLECIPKENIGGLYDNNRSKYDQLKNQMKTQIVVKLQEFIKKAGYKGEILISNAKNNYDMDTGENWFIYDRHMTAYDESAYEPKIAKTLILPFENFLSQMEKYHFLNDIPSSNDIKKHLLRDMAYQLIERKIIYRICKSLQIFF